MRVFFKNTKLLLTFFAGIVAALLFLTQAAHAGTPAGAVVLSPSDTFQVSSGGEVYLCGNIPPWTPGKFVREFFLPTFEEIKTLKKKIKKTTDLVKKAKLKKKLRARKSYMLAAEPYCSLGSGTNQYFDLFGNVTAEGKQAFGIPDNLNANVSAGIFAWNQTCNGCHNAYPSSLPIKTFPYISQRITQAPMLFSVPAEVSFETIANIVAFANFQ